MKTVSDDNPLMSDIFSNKILSREYFNYFAADVIVLRDEHDSLRGKTNVIKALEKLDKEFRSKSVIDSKTSVSEIFGNMMFSHGVYQLTSEDKSISRWNFLQVWKYRNGKWQIVADVLSKIS